MRPFILLLLDVGVAPLGNQITSGSCCYRLTWLLVQDHDCYGRLWYSDPHPTVHSYHKPHWHRSLVPFAPRVMTVREKARIQVRALAWEGGPP